MVELYLYTSIYSYDAERILTALEANKNKSILMRVYSPGGNPMACQGICEKLKALGNVEMQVDGYAASSMIFVLLYAKKVTCLETSKFMMHRAEMYISTPEDQKFLDTVNADYKQLFISRFGETNFKVVTGYTIDELFDPEKRLEINLNAEQAERLGLVQKRIPMTPEMIEAESKRFFTLAAHAPEPTPNNSKPMTLKELQTNHPALYAEVIAAGAAAEKDRVESILAFAEVDIVEVKKLIAAGTNMSAKSISEFAVKAASETLLAAAKTDSSGTVITDLNKDEVKTKEKAELEAFGKNLDKLLKINNFQTAK